MKTNLVKITMDNGSSSFAKIIGDTIIGYDDDCIPMYEKFMVDIYGQYIVGHEDGICKIANSFNIRNASPKKSYRKRGRHSLSKNKEKRRYYDFFDDLDYNENEDDHLWPFINSQGEFKGFFPFECEYEEENYDDLPF